LSDVNKREYLTIPLDLCYFDRERYDKLQTDLPTEILSYRKYDKAFYRILFLTKATTKSGKETERQHLLWIGLMDIAGKQYVKYRCDCQYFEYKQLRPAKKTFGVKEVQNELLVIVDPKKYEENEKLFNIDKHAFIALQEMFNIHIQISLI